MPLRRRKPFFTRTASIMFVRYYTSRILLCSRSIWLENRKVFCGYFLPGASNATVAFTRRPYNSSWDTAIVYSYECLFTRSKYYRKEVQLCICSGPSSIFFDRSLSSNKQRLLCTFTRCRLWLINGGFELVQQEWCSFSRLIALVN